MLFQKRVFSLKLSLYICNALMKLSYVDFDFSSLTVTLWTVIILVPYFYKQQLIHINYVYKPII